MLLIKQNKNNLKQIKQKGKNKKQRDYEKVKQSASMYCLLLFMAFEIDSISAPSSISDNFKVNGYRKYF